MVAQSEINRLSVLPVADKVLLMNRDTAKWVLLNSNRSEAIPFLAVDGSRLSPTQSIAKEQLVTSLEKAALWTEYPAGAEGLDTLLLKLTKVCNYACTYCYDMEENDKLGHMSPEIAITVLAEAIRIAPKKQSAHLADLTVMLHGGEPTLRFPLIEQIVLQGEEMAKAAGKSIAFSGQTNLSRLTTHMVEFSREHRVSWGISMDGPPEINDAFRVLKDGSGTYRYFAKAFREFPEFVKNCGVLTTVNSVTVDKLPEIAMYFRDLGIPNWGWSLFMNIGMARQNTERLGFETEQLVASWNRLFEAVERGEFAGMSVGPVLKYLHNFVFGPGPHMCLRKKCGAGRDFTSVSHDGTIEACDCIDRKGPMGNIGLVQIDATDSLTRARSSEKANYIRSRSIETGHCGECMWLSVCGGTCLAHAGSLTAVDKDECAVSMNAFTRIANSIARSNALRNYLESLPSSRAQKKLARAAAAEAMA